MFRHKGKSLLVLTLGASMVLGTGTAAMASPEDTAPPTSTAVDSGVQELIELDAGEDAADLEQSLLDYATEQGISLEEAVEQAVGDARDSFFDSAEAEEGSDQFGIQATRYLGSGSRNGDVVYFPAKTSGIAHGHSAIYYRPGTIVEAPGTGKVSRSTGASSYPVSSGAKKQYVTTTQANRDKAGNKAYSSYRGKAYNSNFAVNKNVSSAKMNCSQLVWAAYKSTSNIDLDGNGGPGVYPGNIRDSGRTVTYKTF